MRVRCLGSTVSHAGSRIPHFLRSVFWGPQVWLKHAQYSHGFQLACAIREQINIRHAVRGQVERILSGVRRLVGVRSMLQQDRNDVGGTIITAAVISAVSPPDTVAFTWAPSRSSAVTELRLILMNRVHQNGPAVHAGRSVRITAPF